MGTYEYVNENSCWIHHVPIIFFDSSDEAISFGLITREFPRSSSLLINHNEAMAVRPGSKRVLAAGVSVVWYICLWQDDGSSYSTGCSPRIKESLVLDTSLPTVFFVVTIKKILLRRR